jgi:hypothetical protein
MPGPPRWYDFPEPACRREQVLRINFNVDVPDDGIKSFLRRDLLAGPA